MSAERAIPPTPHRLNGSDDAAVIPINARRTRRTAPAPRDRNVGTPPTPPTGPAGQPSDRAQALLLVANDIEQTFNAGGRTLSDDETAAVYTLTLALVDQALEGAAVNGIINEEQRQELAVLTGGMKEAPRLV